MLNHIDWYLVELERRLRNRRSAQSVVDFLVETRAHLDERVEELAGKGLDRVSASKAALADFGDPDSVVAAYSGSAGMSRRALTLGKVVTSAIAAGLVLTICGWIGQRIVFANGSFSAVLVAPWIVAALVLVLAWRSRTWVAVPVCLAAVAAALIGGAWAASNVQVVSIDGERVITNTGAMPGQIAARHAWIRDFDRDFAKIQSWRATRTTAAGDAILKELITDQFLAPYRTMSGSRARMLPSSKEFGDLVGDYGRNYEVVVALLPTPNFKSAKEEWFAEGDRYAASLQFKRAKLDKELVALENPIPTSWGERWQLFGLPVLGSATIGSIILALLNAVVVALVDLRRVRRSVAWRRQVG